MRAAALGKLTPFRAFSIFIRDTVFWNHFYVCILFPSTG